MKDLLLRYTSLFLAFYLLNCSVDAPDALRCNTKENLTYNEQESIVELVVEKALGFDNAIAEYDDTDADNETSFKKTFSVDFYLLPVAVAMPVIHHFAQAEPMTGFPPTITHISEIHCPPPEA